MLQTGPIPSVYASQIPLNIRVDEEIKRKAEAIYSELNKLVKSCTNDTVSYVRLFKFIKILMIYPDLPEVIIYP